VSQNILSVSYDEILLTTRRMLLEQQGYHVTSALGFTEAMAFCNKSRGKEFDLFVLGHSIPPLDKQELIKAFRNSYPAPILALQRHGETAVDGADLHAYPDNPEVFLETVIKILGKGARA